MTSLLDKQISVDSLDSDFQFFSSLPPSQQFDLHSLTRQPSPLPILDQHPKPRTCRVKTADSRELFGGVPMAFGPIMFCYDWDRGEEVTEDFKTPALEEMVKAKL